MVKSRRAEPFSQAILATDLLRFGVRGAETELLNCRVDCLYAAVKGTRVEALDRWVEFYEVV